MGNKRKGYSLLLVGLVLILAISVVACGPSEKELKEELVQLLAGYAYELNRAQEISEANMKQIDQAFREGNVSGYIFRKRILEISVIEANTVKFIDADVRFYPLHDFLWKEGQAPNLAWSIPRDEEEGQFLSYLEDWIAFHRFSVDQLKNFLQQ